MSALGAGVPTVDGQPRWDGEHAQQLLASVTDALNAHIAIIDASGTIVAVNAAWRRFAVATAFAGSEAGVGWNYLEVCDRARGHGSEWARAAAAGIRDVASGQRREFHLEYPAHGRREKRWFQMRVTPLGIPGWLVIAHESITEIKSAQEQLAGAVAQLACVRERLQAENVYLREEIDQSQTSGELVGESEAMRAVLHRIEQAAPTNVTVLIVGETGTGKELVARAIHARSPRSGRPLVSVNCAVLPANLIESELFGHERGAFTGAVARKLGRFELADGGTIFLDEIGDLPLELQAKLLRVLQENEFERLGSPTTHHVDVRVIAATNQRLREAMGAGRFRSDLYYRLMVFPNELPPLRARWRDVPLLVRHFVRKHEGRFGKQIEHIPKRVLDALCAYPWPGNIRELENVIERAIILSPSSTLVIEDTLGDAEPDAEPAAASYRLAEVERNHIMRVIRECGGKVKGKGGAADRLGLKPSTLRSRMQRLGISPSSSVHRGVVNLG
jgi:transcriptional regulator with GAF, ATPase, and Fis domain